MTNNYGSASSKPVECCVCGGKYAHTSTCPGLKLDKYSSPLLNEREKTHGDYEANARCAVRLLDVFIEEESKRAVKLSVTQRHAIEMIIHKIARVVTGDPGFKDHWDDISGYAQLVAARCPVDTPAPAKLVPRRRPFPVVPSVGVVWQTPDCQDEQSVNSNRVGE